MTLYFVMVIFPCIQCMYMYVSHLMAIHVLLLLQLQMTFCCSPLSHREVMSLPALKQHVYSALRPHAGRAMETVEARLNMMQTVFLTLQTKASPTADLLTDVQKIFHALFNRYFTEDIEVGNY